MEVLPFLVFTSVFCWCLFEILVGNDTISIIVQGLNVTVQTREA